MSRKDKQIDEMREAWSRATDDDVLKASLEDWDEYSSEAQLFIKKEVFKRGLQVPVKPVCIAKKTNTSSSEDWIKVVIFLLSLFLIAAIDFGLWKYYEWRDVRILERTKELKLFIEKEERGIENTEKNLKSKDAEIQQALKEINNDSNTKNISNRELLESTLQEYNRLYRDYESRLKTYNEKVREYNSLINKIKTRWYLIPIPMRFGR